MRTKTHFTLIELLVTVAVIAILAGLLLPALNSARKKAQMIRCASNQKSIGQFAQFYANDDDDYMPPACRDAGGPGALQQVLLIKSEHFNIGWVYAMGPYWGARSTWQNTVFNPVFACPSGPDDFYAPAIGGVAYETTNYAYTSRLGARWTNLDVMRKTAKCKIPSKAGYLIDIKKDGQYDAIYNYSACDTVYPSSRFLRHELKINILYADGHVGAKHYSQLKSSDGGIRPLGWADANPTLWPK